MFKNLQLIATCFAICAHGSTVDSFAATRQQTIVPGKVKEDIKKEEKEEKSNYLEGKLSKEDQEYVKNMRAEITKARHSIGAYTEKEKEEMVQRELWKKDKIHVFLGMEAPKLPQIYDYVKEIQKKNTNLQVVIHFLHYPDVFSTIVNEKNGSALDKKFPLTFKFLQNITETDDAFDFLPNTEIAKQFGVTKIPAMGFKRGMGEQRRFLWYGMPNVDLARKQVEAKYPKNSIPDKNTTVFMGEVGPSIDLNIKKIDETVQLLTKLFDVNNLAKMYQYMQEVDQETFEEYAVDVEKFYEYHDGFDPKLKNDRNGYKVRKDDKLPLNHVLPPGKRLFFFDAGSPNDMATARAIGKDGYGFCVKWDSEDQVGAFRAAVGWEFNFLVCADDEIVKEYEISSIPTIMYVNEDRTSYNIETGF